MRRIAGAAKEICHEILVQDKTDTLSENTNWVLAYNRLAIKMWLVVIITCHKV